MKILLLGRSGLLGSEFFEKLSQDPGVLLLSPSHKDLDLLDFKKVWAYIQENDPDMIINCVAYTDVDRAEEEPENCDLINVEILKNLLRSKLPIIHFSSDYVFGVDLFGDKPKDLSQRKAILEKAKQDPGIGEENKVNPANAYARSKAQAEKFLEEYEWPWWNIRTSWIFGKYKTNFITRITKKACAHSEIGVVDDQLGRPTYAKDLADFVVHHFIKNEQKIGHYHLQNSGEPISWADFAEFVIEERKLESKVQRLSSLDYPAKAVRPSYGVLNNTKLPPMPHWKDGVRDYLKN